MDLFQKDSGNRANETEPFTRNRQLTLPRLLIAMINLLNKSLAVELYRYFKNLGKKAVTKQRFPFAGEFKSASV
ncbi:hypothetical protein LEP1GSC016_0943 [Leptospira borgpetersenii serovar Hardjo-bovis str. Sponselee]|uniref:Uncharacterized protein n=1 Tax=Leptospira borgpetersenii serovar Hardjo-bovis str. Sponselee TaxID=1303729 RepID=M6BZ73_LEPBO|nr:hypothetical protein LEP1GSC016_0943 [Leptospira borgpetersenii serovar Hardjo-bovis str. Sponselee]